MDYNMIFSLHVARLLEETGMKKQELAEKAGVSSAVITDLVRAKSNPTIKTMQKISEVFSIPLPMMLKPYESYEWQAWVELWGTGHAKMNSAKLPRGHRQRMDGTGCGTARKNGTARKYSGRRRT